jgi:hypothetical protein
MRKIGNNWYNGNGERIHNICAYMEAVLEDRYGFNDQPCDIVPDDAFYECGIDYDDACPFGTDDDW